MVRVFLRNDYETLVKQLIFKTYTIMEREARNVQEKQYAGNRKE